MGGGAGGSGAVGLRAPAAGLEAPGFAAASGRRPGPPEAFAGAAGGIVPAAAWGAERAAEAAPAAGALATRPDPAAPGVDAGEAGRDDGAAEGVGGAAEGAGRTGNGITFRRPVVRTSDGSGSGAAIPGEGSSRAPSGISRMPASASPRMAASVLSSPIGLTMQISRMVAAPSTRDIRYPSAASRRMPWYPSGGRRSRWTL